MYVYIYIYIYLYANWWLKLCFTKCFDLLVQTVIIFVINFAKTAIPPSSANILAT